MIVYTRITRWLQNIGARLLSAVLISLVTAVIFLLIIFVYRIYFNTPPFDVLSLTRPPAEALCPGDTYEVWVEIKTNRTVVVFIYVTNRTPDGNHVVHPDQPSTLVIPVGSKTQFRQSIKWVVPDVPAGVASQRVLGFRGHDTDEDPLIFGDRQESLQNFVIAPKQQCLAREETK